MSSRPASYRPTRLNFLDSSRMRELINALTPLYSFIIIDAPPVLGLSDTLILGTMVDGVILVVRAGDTAKGLSCPGKKAAQEREQQDPGRRAQWRQGIGS